MSVRSNQVCFVHIAKTAGTALHRLIYKNVGPILFYPPLQPDNLPVELDVAPNSFLGQVAGCDAAYSRAIASVLMLYPAIGGHIDARILPLLREDCFIFTSLRDPIDRLISYYFHYVYPEKDKHFREYANELKFAHLETFLRFKPLFPYLDNHMTRILSGHLGDEPVSELHLHKALGNLEKFDCILFQESLGEGARVIAKALEWQMAEEIDSRVVKISGNRRAMEPSMDFSGIRFEPYTNFDYLLLDSARTMGSNS